MFDFLIDIVPRDDGGEVDMGGGGEEDVNGAGEEGVEDGGQGAEGEVEEERENGFGQYLQEG